MSHDPACGARRQSQSEDRIFKLDQILQGHETFGKAASTKALKLIIEA
jgi:hypothetical protein